MDTDKQENARRPRKKWRIFVLLITAFIILGLAGLSYFWFTKYQEAVGKPVKTNAQELTEKLSYTIDLPPEEPSVATILDTTKLSNPALAGKAVNNDLLLIYPNAKRIILYRPSTQKVIEMMAIQADAAVLQP